VWWFDWLFECRLYTRRAYYNSLAVQFSPQDSIDWKLVTVRWQSLSVSSLWTGAYIHVQYPAACFRGRMRRLVNLNFGLIITDSKRQQLGDTVNHMYKNTWWRSGLRTTPVLSFQRYTFRFRLSMVIKRHAGAGRRPDGLSCSSSSYCATYILRLAFVRNSFKLRMLFCDRTFMQNSFPIRWKWKWTSVLWETARNLPGPGPWPSKKKKRLNTTSQSDFQPCKVSNNYFDNVVSAIVFVFFLLVGHILDNHSEDLQQPDVLNKCWKLHG